MSKQVQIVTTAKNLYETYSKSIQQMLTKPHVEWEDLDPVIVRAWIDVAISVEKGQPEDMLPIMLDIAGKKPLGILSRYSAAIENEEI